MTRLGSQPPGVRRRTLLLCAAALVAMGGVATCGAAPTLGEDSAAKPAQPCTVFRVRPQDQVWAVSTRWLGCPVMSQAEPAWTVWKYDPQAPRWLSATPAEFYATDSPDVVTAMFIHGNRIDSSLALRDGLDVYFHVAGKFDGERPVRFVIWSWPSDQIRGPLKDVRSKAARSDVEAYYLARFLAAMRPEVKTGLIGYSYGARIIAGGLHLLGGGQLLGWTVPPGERPRVQVAFWAAAEHHHWLLPGHYHGQALSMADRWFITHNCCDGVLARYRFIEKCGDPVALGYSGVYGRNLLRADWNSRIEEMNVTQIVGQTHRFEPYSHCAPIIDRTRAAVLWRE